MADSFTPRVGRETLAPYACGRRWRLYAGDCVDVLAANLIPAGTAIIGDPPYGIAYEKGAGGSCVTGRGTVRERRWGPISGDDRPFDPVPWSGFSPVLLWGANHFAGRLPPGGRWLAWNKLGGWEPFGDSFSDVEFAWCSSPGASRIFSLLWKGVRQDEKENGGTRHHPSQKPVGLMRWSIEMAGCKQGQPVFDGWCGSGSTGVAALRAGLEFIGAECDERYLDIAARRLGDAEAAGVQLSLLSEDVERTAGRQLSLVPRG